MSIKEFFGKAAAGIYVSGLSVIALVVALIGYIMYGTEKNNLEAVIVVFTVIAVVAGLMEMILTLAKGYRPMWDNMTIVYAILEADQSIGESLSYPSSQQLRSAADIYMKQLRPLR